MNAKLDPLVVDSLFFTSLIKANLPALDQVLAHDFILIDVMSGSEVTRSSLLAVIGSGQVKFESIEPADNRVRLYKTTAVVTGRTRMKGRLGDAPFVASSRYTHVFVMDKGEWRLVAAQGTADLTEAGTASNLVGAPNAVETADFWNFSPLQRKSIAVQSRPRSFQNERRESLLEPLSSARRRVFPSRVPAGSSAIMPSSENPL